ncbi:MULTISPECIES: alkaline phosphatase [Asticcacaulis]|uniref:alkaline phosphatase n=1 Tax=Asticcacaulis TaxID=76890 RepID=UPI001AE2AC3F|nr:MULTISPECIES: alkaline phosphatase [Asticcacaulis]MBP2158092.1 alkaline phosphatase [Asticcacaulis solisilvae]MDR6799137.1 alkaline phosphatase [Asticcacaulis sp. BE141]
MHRRLLALCFAAAILPACAMGADKSQNIYYVTGKEQLEAALKRVPNTGKAKNVILFIGDGMGINSVTAGRILAGQVRGETGVTYQLAFDQFPYTGLSKTYSTDNQVTDSANGISAITTGVKTINGGVGVDGSAKRNDCPTSLSGHVRTIAEQARLKGLSAGVVTTSGVTDATPAGAYGHVSTRNWRSDAELPEAAAAAGCIDLARQAVEAPANIRMNVIMGGDLARFVPVSAGGKRKDGRDLTQTWAKQTRTARVLRSETELKAFDPKSSDHVLGLFAPGDLPSQLDRAQSPDNPKLADMTDKAISVLSRNPKGYFLLVESASIDKWHHVNDARRALHDVEELSDAVAVAAAKTNPEDTLIIVTADHSHGVTQSGYASLGEPILGLARIDGQAIKDGKGHPYAVINYATGPGADHHGEDDPELSQDTLTAGEKHPALVPMTSAAHSGEDVPVYARGPQAHLLTGVNESSYIYQVMAYALGIDGPAKTAK